jgi:hypothetical protein
MTSGTIVISWDAEGRLNIKTSLELTGSDSKKVAINVLLDAAKAINDTGTRIVTPERSSVRILTGKG